MRDRTVWIVFAKDLREVLRDRRTVLAAFVLPFFLYPLLTLWMSAMGRGGQGLLGSGEPRDKKMLPVALVGEGERLLPLLLGRNFNIAGSTLDLEALRDGKLAAICALESGTATIHYSSTVSDSTEARNRLRAAIEEYRNERVKGLFAKREVHVVPTGIARIEAVDLASTTERSAAKLARILPFFLILIALMGGAFAALDVIAGEKERGTLETLFIHPADRNSILRGKFLVVVVTTAAALVANLAALALGIATTRILRRPGDGFDLDISTLASPALLAQLALIVAPIVVLSSALLLMISAYARSFREAQTYLLPLTLLTLPLLLLSAAPAVTLDSIVAWVPLAGSALAVRELLEGRLQPGSFAIVLGTSSVYAWLALRQARSLLEREDLLLDVEEPLLLASADARARRATFWAAVLVLGVYFIGSWIQVLSLKWGLFATLWGVVLIPGLLYPLRSRDAYRDTLAWKLPGLGAVLLSPLIAGALAILATHYFLLQDRVLPMPQLDLEFFAELKSWSPAEKIFLLCISPGICEEILWRGAFQGELEPRRRPLRTLLMVGFFFGVFHLSAYRLVPTGLIGAVLACWRQRTGSIFPGMIVHSSYNAILVFAADSPAGKLDHAWLQSPWLVLAAGVVLALALWWGAPQRRRNRFECPPTVTVQAPGS